MLWIRVLLSLPVPVTWMPVALRWYSSALPYETLSLTVLPDEPPVSRIPSWLLSWVVLPVISESSVSLR